LYLAGKGYRIDILYHDNEGEASDSFSAAQKFYTQHGIKLTKLDVQKYVDGEMSARAVSYAVYQFLKDPRLNYEFIHFHDYKGMGFFSCSAKHQRLAFDKTDLVVQIHGPTRWTIEANSAFFTHEDQLHIDYLERGSLRWADQLVAPSQYIAQWVNENFFPDSHKDIRVIKNLCRSLVSEIQAVVNESEASCEETADLSEIIIFGRHEDRKGISIACDALDHISDLIAKRGIKISFVGAPGSIFGQPSAIYFVEKAKKWKFPVNFHFGLNRSEAAAYLASSTNSLVVIPSPKENSPYTVLEALVLKKPILCSLEGGGAELVHPNDRHNACCLMTAEALAETIRGIIMHGLKPTRAAENLETIEDAWLSFHHHKTKEQRGTAPTDKPMVTVGITHFERPKKAIDALISILRQTYQNFEVIMVDDGSSTPETLESLNYIETLLSRVGGRMIRRENGYLGAARNSILKEARGQYILFLDDDDVAMPEMLEKLVQSALETRADVTTCLNVFMPEDRRGDVLSGGDLGGRVSYFPLGGPLALAPEQNVFGSATSLIRRQALDKINGYTELKNVGHEDYELYIRLAQAGATIVVCPEALFFYEVGRPSMISQTGMVRNFRRCFDALDMHSGSYPFSDYINLSAGQKIAINSHNRNWWINGQKETSSIRHKIMQCNN
ncbi:MAG: glycosyltransferase, partial [Acetomicrobium sp.]|nr:glycosyltransferase [Acetomicrobium sp.]